MPDALLRLRLAEQAQKRLPLQIEHMLFRHPRALWDVAPGNYVRELAGDVRVVVADVAAGLQVLHAHVERRAHPFPADPEAPGKGGPVAGLRHRRGYLFCVADETLRVQRDAVALPEVAEPPALLR